MKKHLVFCNLLVFFLFLFFADSLSAQNTFYKNYDYSGDDFGNFVIQTSDGGYAIIGSTNSLGAGNYDIWLLKTDSSGDTLWTKTYGGPDNDEGYCLRETNDNGFIIAGDKTVPGNSRDGWVFKTDANGNVEWEHTFGTELNGESASSIVNAGNNSFLVSGNLSDKSYVFKIDDQGNIIWEHSYFSNNASSTSSICSTSNNGYAVAGSFQMYAAGGWYPNMFTIDSEGNLIYQLTYMNIGQGFLQFIIGTSDNGIVFGGKENGENVVYKNSLDGLEQWKYNYQSAPNTFVRAAAETADNNIVISDNSQVASLRKLNTITGDTLWTRSSNFSGYPKYTNMTTTSDNGLIITGYTFDHGVILVKTLENGGMTGISDNNNWKKSISLMQNSPNPFSESTTLTISLPINEVAELIITDVSGKRISTLLQTQLSAGEHKITWNGVGDNGLACADGIYFATLKLDSGLCKTIKMIKK